MSQSAAQLLVRYLRQQAQLSVPDHIFSSPLDLSSLANTARFVSSSRPPVSAPPVPVPGNPDIPVEHNATVKTELVVPATIRERLVALYQNTRECAGCRLCRGRKKFVFGSGNAQAPIMVIGDAPGPEEDAQGLPFVGPAGQLLTKMLLAVNINRGTDVFLTTVLKCRPEGDRIPDPADITACIAILKQQIAIIVPKAILLLGLHAARALLGSADELRVLRASVHQFEGIAVMVTHDPADLIDRQDLKRQAWSDLQKFRDLLQKTGIHGAT